MSVESGSPADRQDESGGGPSWVSPPSAPGGVVATLGELIELRLKKGFDVSLVSSRLRLAPRQIVALEAGDWQALPGRTFIRASLRSYGRLLEVDVAPLLDAVGPQLPGGEVLKPDSELKRPMPRQGALGFGGSGSGNRWVWFLLLAVGIVALAFFYGGGATLLNRDVLPSGRAAVSPADSGVGQRSADPVEGSVGRAAADGLNAGSAPAAQLAPVSGGLGAGPLIAATTVANGSGLTSPVAPPTALIATGAAAPVQPSPAPANAAQTAAPPSRLSGPAEPSPLAASPTAAPIDPTLGRVVVSSMVRPAGAAAGLNPLVMRFPSESWIEVRDASGTVLVTGTQAPGTVREVSGELPLSLIIGNAVSVAVSWRGVPIDVGPHLRQGVARLRIE